MWRMMIDMSSLGHLSDRDLLARLHDAAGHERDATAQLVALLMELDARRLYLAEGCASLFTYCQQVLHLSEHAAYHRIEAARAARRFPLILERLVDGTVNLTAIGLLAPLLTPQNHVELLDAARYKSKREIEQLVAQVRPRPDAPTVIRKLPEPKPPAPSGVGELTVEGRDLRVSRDGANPAAGEMNRPSPDEATIPVPPSPRADVKPLAPERYRIQFTVDRETHDKLRRAQDFLRHAIPDGDPAAIFDKALTLLIRDLSRAKHAAVSGRRRSAPRPGAPPAASRHIPAFVRREVWRRDGEQCAFIGARGRCTEKGFLEFHHLVPYAAGGEATIANLELRCRAHNAYASEQYYGACRAPLPPDARENSSAEFTTRSGPSST
jgi:5-methylcytosine-specific restriction endonuclease McrA